jgi:putative transposase
MARKIRIEYAGAAYHVMARGNQGRDIYADDRDRKLWLETLGQACEKTGWRIHAWVMMNNHYHLLLETPEPNLVAGMKWLQGTYTQRYNSRHEIFGHLFQGRYKAVLVEPEGGNYFAVVSTYIHLNPARAGLIRVGKEGLGGYRWSSYPWYVRAGEARPKWFVTEHVLGNLGLPPEGRKGYKAYLEGRVLELGLKRGRKELAEEWKAIRRGWYVGGTDFKERMLALVEQPLRQGRRGSYSGEAKRAHGEAEAERLLACGLAALGMTEGQLAETRKGAWEKEVLAGWLCQHTTARRRWVSERLGMGDESRVTQAIGRLKRKGQPKLERLKRRLEQVYENHNREAEA